MKKSIYNKRGTRQIVNSGWKLFDKQTNCIGPGNCVFNTQVSSFIRPWKQLECNGRVNPEGHLTNFDLEGFRRYNIPSRMLEILRDKNREESMILYMFFVLVNGEVEPFGWALTTKDYGLVASSVVRRYGQSYAKRYNALYEAIEYITR